MKDRITILADNKAEKPLKCEHGFSLVIETGSKKILFDTGQGDSLFHNAEILGIPLNDLDILVLSHGHYDHGGNIKKILEINPSIDFYAHPDCLKQRFSYHKGQATKSASLTEENIEAIRNLPEKQLHWCINEVEITQGVWVTGSIPRNNDYEDTGGAFFTDISRKNPDLLPDDMSLWIEKDDSLTIICGCCHSGLQNTVEKVLSISNISRISTILGGLHLVHAGETRMNKTITFINSCFPGIPNILCSHCTGDNAVELLTEKLGSTISTGTVGLSINI